jgi:hypothetical protein
MHKILLAIVLFVPVVSFHFYGVVAQGEQAKSFNLMHKIDEARELAKKENVQMITGVVGTRRVRIGRRRYKDVPITGVIGREVALAIMDAEGKIAIVRAMKNDSGFHVQTPGYQLYVRRENGLNSDISCVTPAGAKVLALKYPISNENGRFGVSEPVVQAVYTPYSGEIKTEEVIKHGIKVQSEFIDKAYSHLKERKIYSRAFEGKLVTDVIPKDICTVLLMNEHIDPGEFKNESNAKALVERVLTIIGTNRDKSYCYSISSAGAHGLVQMIPSTYRRMESLYPSAGLASNFAVGMCDPVNSIMAQVLLCDSDWHSMRAHGEIPVGRVGPYLAASYNGGVGRVISCLSHDEANWMEAPEDNQTPTQTVTRKVAVRVRTRRGGHRTAYISKSYTTPIFRSETNKYVRQYHWINNFFAARNQKGFQPMQEDPSDEEKPKPGTQDKGAGAVKTEPTPETGPAAPEPLF